MNEFEEFYKEVGILVLSCQLIEHDVKQIYCGLVSGNYLENFEKIKRETLGSTVYLLKELDTKNNDPYISLEDYALLEQMTKIRNYWIHLGYIHYMYDDKNFMQSFHRQKEKLFNDSKKLSNLQESITSIRLLFFKN